MYKLKNKELIHLSKGKHHDGEPRLLEDTALLRSEIFDTVKSINPQSVTVFLDACYSGQTREKDMILADARPIAIIRNNIFAYLETIITR